MQNISVRPFRSSDFDTIMEMEETVFAADGEKVLGQYYVRLCCDFFADNCFIAETDDGIAAGYLLSMQKGGEVYCTTLAVAEPYRSTKAVWKLLGAFVSKVVDSAEVCWFTVDEDNTTARRLHKLLGATELGLREDFYGPGNARIVSQIDRLTLQRLKPKYQRLGLLPKETAIVKEAA